MAEVARLLVDPLGSRVALVEHEGEAWELRVYDCSTGAVKFQRRCAVSETMAQALWDGLVEVRGSASDETLRYVVREDVQLSRVSVEVRSRNSS